MERFRNILFAAAGGKEDGAALDRANRLAFSNKARITLVRVVEDMPLAASCFFSKERLAELTAATRAVAQADLDRLVEKLDPAVRAETLVLNGKPFIELIRTVLGQGHDLLIKSGPAVTDSPALAGTDLHLLRKCPCPVWIIKPTQRKPFGKILVADGVDGVASVVGEVLNPVEWYGLVAEMRIHVHGPIAVEREDDPIPPMFPLAVCIPSPIPHHGHHSVTSVLGAGACRRSVPSSFSSRFRAGSLTNSISAAR